ncbi:MAG: phosphoglucosamine mutase [Candidatus Margulisbacteria bacterium]|nr:phosphoglucosamine mutase [Candidatus Margulisiibacteriota bacterium]
MSLIISISGVRGLVPESLTPEVCLDLAKAFGTYLDGGKVVVGTDPRQSSEFIKGIIFSGLLSTGCKVVDLGIAPTPTVGIMTRELEAAGGIVVTASHNPLPWNGLKFMRGDGIFLNEAEGTEFLKIYKSKQWKTAPARGVSVNRTGLDVHIKKVLKAINAAAVKKAKFKVVYDGCNGAGSIAMVRFLEKLGCQVFAVNCSTKLPFPHNPEPVAANLGELMELVKSKNADIGFAVDSDADRLAIVSDEGKAIGEELTLALAVKFVLGAGPAIGTKKPIVVVNLSTSRVIDDVCEESGALLIRTKVGEVNVTEELKNLKGLIGGEGNGGVIYPKVGWNRDSLSGAGLVLSLLAESGKKVSQLVADLPHYEMIKTKVECASRDEANDFMEKTKAVFNGYDLILTEGVKVVLPDSWIHIRPSNTEPIVRIIAEAKTKDQAEELIKKVTA